MKKMREILFRGKCADNYKNSGKWAEGYLLRFTEKRNPFIMLKDGGGECVEVIPESVGQYTGLTDKNGTKIFEGDIVDILTENEEVGAVTYDDGGFVITADGFTVSFLDNINGTDIRVIGNIYDNI